MTGGDDEGKLLKGAYVGCELLWQAIESVRSTFDLVAVQVAIEDSEIDPAPSVREPQFVNHQDVVASMMMTQVAMP